MGFYFYLFHALVYMARRCAYAMAATRLLALLFDIRLGIIK